MEVGEVDFIMSPSRVLHLFSLWSVKGILFQFLHQLDHLGIGGIHQPFGVHHHGGIGFHQYYGMLQVGLERCHDKATLPTEGGHGEQSFKFSLPLHFYAAFLCIGQSI